MYQLFNDNQNLNVVVVIFAAADGYSVIVQSETCSVPTWAERPLCKEKDRTLKTT